MQNMIQNRIQAIVAVDDPVVTQNIKLIAQLAIKHKLPVIGSSAVPDAGGLMGYGTNVPEMFRHAATYVDKILKGAKPADLPVQQPIKFDFIVNTKTARALGVKLSSSTMLRADKVIE